MANEENLTQMGKHLTREEAQKIGSLGGKASVKARRERKALREQMIMLLSLPLKNDKIKDKLKELGIKESDMNNQMAMSVSMYQQALKGNPKAYELIRDTIGEKPVEQIQNITPPTINIQRPDE